MVITIIIVIVVVVVVVFVCITMCHKAVSRLNLFLHNNTSLLINGVPLKVVSMELYAISPVTVLPF